MAQRQRNSSIDFLRGIAVLLVIITHINWLPSGILGQLFYPFNLGGWMGVDLFFVLSGYLISGLLFKEYQQTGTINPGLFLIRRGFKIYPAFWFLLFTTWLVSRFITIHPDAAAVTATNYVHELLFVQNYFTGVWSHTWSLAIEEHFYLLFALFLYFVIKYRQLNLKVVAGAYLALMLVCLGFRAYYNLVEESSQCKYNFAMTHLRIDALFFGVLLSYLSFYKPSIIKRVVSYKYFLLPLCFLFLGLSVYYGHSTTWGITLLLLTNSWVFGYLLVTAIQYHWGSGRFLQPVVVTGRSYSIYLWHIIVKEWIVNKQTLDYLGLHLKWSYEQLLYIFVSIVCGIVFSNIIEIPFVTIRDKYFSSPEKKIYRVKLFYKEFYVLNACFVYCF